MATRVIVHGEVQGVFFRDSVSREAQSRSVSGWVRNNDDGTVEAVFAGERAGELVDYCRSGPPDASVTDVDVSEAGDEALPDGFEVR